MPLNRTRNYQAPILVFAAIILFFFGFYFGTQYQQSFFANQNSTEIKNNDQNLENGQDDYEIREFNKNTFPVKANLGDEFNLKRGQMAIFANTNLSLTLTLLTLPATDKIDTQFQIGVEALNKGRKQELIFVVGGNQPQELAEARRTKDFDGYRIRVQKVTATEITFKVTKI